MKLKVFFFTLTTIFFICSSLFADDIKNAKGDIVSKISNSIVVALESIIGTGIADTNVCYMWPEEPVVTIALTE